jgi:hypothetical protein
VTLEESLREHMRTERATLDASFHNVDRQMREDGLDDATRFQLLAWLRARYDELLVRIERESRLRTFGGGADGERVN